MFDQGALSIYWLLDSSSSICYGGRPFLDDLQIPRTVQKNTGVGQVRSRFCILVALSSGWSCSRVVMVSVGVELKSACMVVRNGLGRRFIPVFESIRPSCQSCFQFTCTRRRSRDSQCRPLRFEARILPCAECRLSIRGVHPQLRLSTSSSSTAECVPSWYLVVA